MELRGIILPEEVLETQFFDHMEKQGFGVSRDGSVNVEIFEEVRKEAQNLFHELFDGLDEPTAMKLKLRRSWPLSEGRFLCEAELCQ